MDVTIVVVSLVVFIDVEKPFVVFELVQNFVDDVDVVVGVHYQIVGVGLVREVISDFADKISADVLLQSVIV